MPTDGLGTLWGLAARGRIRGAGTRRINIYISKINPIVYVIASPTPLGRNESRNHIAVRWASARTPNSLLEDILWMQCGELVEKLVDNFAPEVEMAGEIPAGDMPHHPWITQSRAVGAVAPPT